MEAIDIVYNMLSKIQSTGGAERRKDVGQTLLKCLINTYGTGFISDIITKDSDNLDSIKKTNEIINSTLQSLNDSSLEEIASILSNNGQYCVTLLDGKAMQVGFEWEYNGCKNDDDAIDYANEFAEEIVNRFPQLEIKETFCHRHKYSVAVFKIKEDETK